MAEQENEIRKAYELFHKVWGDSKDQFYIKRDWAELHLLLSKIINQTPFKP